MWFLYFKNKAGNLRVHIKTVHEGHTSDYKCDSCDKGHKDHKCDSCENHSLKVVIKN